MPIVNVKLLAGAYTEKQKHAMIHEMTQALVNVSGETVRQQVIVMIEEVPDGMWGIGGNRLTVAEIEERRRKRAASGTA